MTTFTVRVALGERSYDIHVSDSDLQGIGPLARQRVQSQRAFIVTDEHVLPHAEQVRRSLDTSGIVTELKVVQSGEERKSLATASDLYDWLIGCQADRHCIVVPVGGGVLGDLAGFVAATYARGIPLLMVPTTLLAMVDSSVGGKVAVNHPRGKNMIGAFHQPVGVWIAISTLQTLPDRDYRSGLAEVVKYGVIMDTVLFSYLEHNVQAIMERDLPALRHIVSRCCQLKADVVEQDEREERGVRAILNYGHTFAHAFETAAGYSAWLHGEAVAAGMMCAAHLAVRRGLIDSDFVDRQRRLIASFGLPTKPETWRIESLIATMRTDKKAVGGKLRFILPTKLGEVALFDDVPEAEVIATLQAIQAE